jgi:quinol monooxygenase YgiN
MIVVLGEIRVAEGAVEVVRDAIATMEAESRKEPGCHTYAFSEDLSDPTLVRITEVWESLADLQAHFTMPHMAEFGAALGKLDIQSMQVKAYELGAPVPMPV